MTYKRFIKDKLLFLISILILDVFVFLMGNAFKVSDEFCIATIILFTAVILIFINAEFVIKRSFYNEMEKSLESLDQKYLITEMIKKPEFAEGKIFVDTLYETDKSMKEHLNEIEITTTEFKEYLELWIHEIKVPISALKLMIFNDNSDPVKLKQQVEKINYYVEQILFFARADAAEKDYLLKTCKLETVINKVIMDQKTILIGNKIAIEKKNVDAEVITDSKWLEYMISQIVNNAVKYSDSGKKSYIKFYTTKDKDITNLIIEDNGIGISERDIPSVFDKTFTGENGRKDRASTGMGLYICKKLADKLGHTIGITSVEKEYTRVTISFGNNSFMKIED